MNPKARAILLISIVTATAQMADASRYFRIVTDSVYNYSFDQNEQSYKLASIAYYYYNAGILDSIISASSERIPVSKTLYFHSEGLLTGLRTYTLRGGLWEPGQNQELFYDDLNRMVRNVVTVWRTDHWENLNIFTQAYDVIGNLAVFHRDFWSNNRWTDFSTDSLFYDQNGHLQERSAWLTSTGNYLTRILYNYSSAGVQNSQTRQFWVNSNWENSGHTYYLYNKCGTQTFSFGEKWLNGIWVKDTKSEIFTHFEILPRVRRVPVCYRGCTKFIRAKYLERYLAAGACLGECIDPGTEVRSSSASEPVAYSKPMPFVIFPNPASDYVNIKLTNPECPVTRVELLDYYGRPVRRFDANGEEMLSIDLTTYKNGNYILRVTAGTVYSNVISKR